MATNLLVLRPGVRARQGIRWRLTESQVLFIGLSMIYFGAGCFLALNANVIYGDAWSRVEIAERVIFSRDPHLAAIGFVWSPLPILALLPLVSLKVLWPQLVTLGLANVIVSATCMAGAAIQIRGTLRDAGLGRAAVLLLTAAFAFHPLIFFFGANGMSEAMLLLFLVMAVRYFTRWLRDSNLNSLIATGIALMLAYFSRYEALPGALGVIGVVAVVSWVRVRRQHGSLWSVLCDVAIVAAPVALAFVVWSVASWLITGQAFDQFTSVYVNRNKVPTGYAPWSSDLLSLLGSQLASLEPLLPALLLVLLALWRRRALGLTLASAACLGATLAFMVLAQLRGSLTHELRYVIIIVPLTVLLACACISSAIALPRKRALISTAVAVACMLSMAVAVPASARAMLDSRLDPYAAALGLQSVFSPTTDSQLGGALNWTTERAIAGDLDQMHLAEGSVLVDDFLGWPIVATSSSPKQFVITSDRDFETALRDPKGTGIQYILVPQPSYFGNLDAVNRLFPTFYVDGAGFASLVKEYEVRGINDSTWRLYHIN